MTGQAELRSLLPDLWGDLHDLRVMWQVAIVAASLLAAWMAGRAIRPKLVEADGSRSLGQRAAAEIQFPLTALVVVLAGRAALSHWQSVHLLNLVVPLLVSLAIIRCIVVMLRQVFEPGGWLKALVRTIGWVVWIGFALHVTGLAPDLIRFLDEAGLHVGKTRVTLLLVLQGAASVLATLLIALWLGRFIEGRLMNAPHIDINLRVMLSKLAQAALSVLAILIALPAVGIDLTVLSVFGGMLGVGLGFGLQKIASNYVSGFIILLDRSVAIGDLVSVGEHTGELTRMTSRYVVLRSVSGVEAIIPNETIITSTVVNSSYTDRRVRVALPLQVGYGTDLDVAMGIMTDAARRHPLALGDPEPRVLLKQFGDSGIDLELGVWMADPLQGQAGMKSDIYLAIWREFRARGIDIPYPHRVVHLQDKQPDNENRS